MTAAEAVGITLAGLGIRRVFGVVGSGNFHVTNALVSGGARFVAARHEGGAATMADAYSRMSGTVAALTVHQGCGLTNAMTGIAEAAKSRTPLVVLAADVTEKRSNFYVDQDGLADSVGAVTMRVEAVEAAVATAARAYHLARDDRRTVVLNLPLAVQAAKTAEPTRMSEQPRRPQTAPDAAGLAPARRRADPRAAPGIRRRARRACPRSARGAARTRRGVRGAARHERRRERALPRQPLVARRLGRVRFTARCAVDPRRRPDRRLGLRAEHVDDPARSPHRAAGDGRASRPRSRRARRAPRRFSSG